MLKIGNLLILFIMIAYANSGGYRFDTFISPTHPYVGQKVKVEFRFSFKDAKNIAEVNFSPPLFNNLHVKKREENSTKNTQSWIYYLIPQSDKNCTISKAYLDVAIKKGSKKLGNYDELDYDYISLETKKVLLNIQHLTDKTDLKLFGEFDIKAKIKKDNYKTILLIQVKGDGNLEDIGRFELKLPNTTIYTDTPIIQKGEFTQQFIIINKNSFTIPSFSITYLDNKTKKIITKKTTPIMVEIKKQQFTTSKKIDTKWWHLLVIFILGIMIGFVVSKLNFSKPYHDKDFLEKLKSSKTTKQILNLLLSREDKNLIPLIKELEDDLYIAKEKKLTRKSIIKKYLLIINKI